MLRGLEYLRRAGVAPDERVTEAIELVASKRDGDGRWPLEVQYPGVMPVEIDEGEGQPSLSEQAKLETERLVKLSLPPGSTVVGGPYRMSQGNNPTACQGDSVEYVIGTSLTPKQVDDHLTHKSLPGWSREVKTASSVSWVKTEGPFAKIVLTEYQPWYVGGDSDVGRKLKQASEQYATSYLLTVIVTACADGRP